jgi:hypothetical protein
MVLAALKESASEHGKTIKYIDSNLFHFIIYDVCKKDPDIELTRGWYLHGPYIPAVDDVLVEMGMDPKYHQLNGTDTSMCEKMIEYV